MTVVVYSLTLCFINLKYRVGEIQMQYKSRREVRVDFTNRLAMFGGTLGLFTGMSILSMIEVFCLVIKLLKKSLDLRK